MALPPILTTELEGILKRPAPAGVWINKDGLRHVGTTGKIRMARIRVCCSQSDIIAAQRRNGGMGLT